MGKRDEFGWVWPDLLVKSGSKIERSLKDAARPRGLSLPRAEAALRSHFSAIGFKRRVEVRWVDFQEAYAANFRLALEASRKVLRGEKTPLLPASQVALECGPMAAEEAKVYAAGRAALYAGWDRAVRLFLLKVPSYGWLARPEPKAAAAIRGVVTREAADWARGEVLRHPLPGGGSEVGELARKATHFSCHWAFELASRVYGRAWWEEKPGPELDEMPQAWLPLIEACRQGLWCFWIPPGDTVWAVPRPRAKSSGGGGRGS